MKFLSPEEILVSFSLALQGGTIIIMKKYNERKTSTNFLTRLHNFFNGFCRMKDMINNPKKEKNFKKRKKNIKG
jgi:hypothetical protein